jgi:hypothetical protein
MTLPKGFVAAFVIICEKILVEKDEMQSAIRIADIFQFQRLPGVVGEPIIPINVLVQVRFLPTADPTHTLELRLIRPDGEMKTVGPPVTQAMHPKFPDVSIGYNFGAVFGVIARLSGIHYVVLFLDGQEVARAPFSLIERPLE